MHRIVAVFVLLLVSASASVAQGIALEPAAAGLLKVHATVGGREGVFLFDSGSGVSSVSPEFATAIGCHPWGRIVGFRMTGDRLEMQRCDRVAIRMGGRSFAAGTVGVFDLGKYLPGEVGHIDGSIALDVFADQAFLLSLGEHTIRLLDGGELARRSRGLQAMPVHVVRDAEGLALTVNLPVTTPAGTAWFEMDSGNTSGLVLVSQPLAALFGLGAGKESQPIHLTLGDGTVFAGEARVLDLILDGNLGTSFLLTHDVTVDLRGRLAWVSAASAPAGR